MRNVAELDSDQPLSRPRSMRERPGRQIAQPRRDAVVLGVFAGGALVLALVGVYGVMHYLVCLRTREFGIRIALETGPHSPGVPAAVASLTGLAALAIPARRATAVDPTVALREE